MNSSSTNVSDEDFKSIYAVDREIYTRLTVNLNRAAEESVHVIAFLMWLQSDISENKGVLARLMDLSDGFVTAIVDECLSCLKCVVSEIPPFTDGVYDIVLLPKLLGLNLTLQVLHEHRSEAIDGVKFFVKNVCVRAFKDIYFKVKKGESVSPATVTGSNPSLNVKDGKENMVKTPARANEGNGDHGGIFAAAVNDQARNPAAAIVNRAAGGLNDGPPGIKPLELAEIGGGGDVYMDELRKIFTPLNPKKFGQIEDHPGENKIGPAIPKPVKNNSTATGRTPPPALHLLAASFKPYRPLRPPPSVVYTVYPSADHQRGLLFTPPPAGQLPGMSPASNWANHTQGNATDYAEIPPSPPPKQPEFLSYTQSSGGEYGGRHYSTNIQPQQDCVNYNDLDNLLPDDRTIFLTFSKGYPIAASDITEFFTRKFGDVIERLYMQIVRPNEEVLYARLVCRSPLGLQMIIRGGSARYNINGRHCRARKYVKKLRILRAATASM